MCVGANFVLKAFTILEEFTVSLVYLMWCAFSDISITKPGNALIILMPVVPVLECKGASICIHTKHNNYNDSLARTR